MSNTQLYQIIPNDVCLSCDVCCRFLEPDSPLAPIFTEEERKQVISQGTDPAIFRPQIDENSTQVKLKPYEDYYICPYFEPETSKCLIYKNRPFDCKLYPFALMYNEDRSSILLGLDTLCPFGEAHLHTEKFQQHLQHVIDYVESDEVRSQITVNWSLIGDYQGTVKVFHTLNQDVTHATTSFNTG